MKKGRAPKDNPPRSGPEEGRLEGSEGASPDVPLRGKRSPRAHERFEWTPDVESKVRAVVLDLVRGGRTFRAVDVANTIQATRPADVGRVARALRELYEGGHLRPFAYKRTISRHRTAEGTFTVTAYAPRRPIPSRTISGRPVIATGAAAALTAPRRAERSSPFDRIALRDARLARHANALRSQMETRGRDLIRMGELLEGVRSLLGPRDALAYFERELRISRSSALRLMRVSAALKRHPHLDVLALARPSVLYKLTEPLFPSDLREAILARGGLTIDGVEQPLETIRVRDLVHAKRGWQKRGAELRALTRELHLDRSASPEREAEIRRRLAHLGREPPTSIATPSWQAEQATALESLAQNASRLARRAGALEGTLDEETRQRSIDALRRLLSSLERG